MKEDRELRTLRRRTKRVKRAIVRTLRNDPELRSFGVQFLRKDERLVAEEATGLKAYWVSYGGYIDACQVVTQVIEAPRDIVGFHVFEQQKYLKDRDRWKKLENLAVQRVREEVKQRIEVLKRAGQWNDHTSRLLVGLWPSEIGSKSWIENDNWYFHVLMNIPFGGVVLGS